MLVSLKLQNCNQNQNIHFLLLFLKATKISLSLLQNKKLIHVAQLRRLEQWIALAGAVVEQLWLEQQWWSLFMRSLHLPYRTHSCSMRTCCAGEEAGEEAWEEAERQAGEEA